MKQSDVNHISTDDLEFYLADKVNHTVAATTIEVHVRVCQECADRMLALEHFSKLMQADLLTSRCADR